MSVVYAKNVGVNDFRNFSNMHQGMPDRTSRELLSQFLWYVVQKINIITLSIYQKMLHESEMTE